MKRCQMCGATMSVAAELTEGARCYTWYKCLNINCGSVFLIQKSLEKMASPVERQERASAAAG